MLASVIKQDDEKATAFHEAGHAVIAVILNLSFEYVSIAPDEDEDAVGHIQYGIVPVRLRAGQRSASRELRKHLLANRAGSIAEERYAGRRNEIGAFADDLEFRQCLREMYGERLDRHARDLSRQAQRLVTAHWQTIGYVADALLQRQQLSFAAVAQLVTGITAVEPPAAAHFR